MLIDRSGFGDIWSDDFMDASEIISAAGKVVWSFGFTQNIGVGTLEISLV